MGQSKACTNPEQLIKYMSWENTESIFFSFPSKCIKMKENDSVSFIFIEVFSGGKLKGLQITTPLFHPFLNAPLLPPFELQVSNWNQIDRTIIPAYGPWEFLKVLWEPFNAPCPFGIQLKDRWRIVEWLRVLFAFRTNEQLQVLLAFRTNDRLQVLKCC